jgi:hypothetical protein
MPNPMSVANYTGTNCEQANDTRSMPKKKFQEHNNKNPISTDFLATDQFYYSQIVPSLYQLPVMSCN